jgi:hypothetical protein
MNSINSCPMCNNVLFMGWCATCHGSERSLQWDRYQRDWEAGKHWWNSDWFMTIVMIALVAGIMGIAEVTR